VVEEASKRDKTSLVIDRKKVERVKRILGTTTLSETVDRALEDVINNNKRMALLERIKREVGIGPGPEELRRLREPRTPP
jgi:Arc/MetJ family transcription regulator